MATSVPVVLAGDGQANVGRGQRRRVVQAVAHHRHPCTRRQTCAQLTHHAGLVGRQHLGAVIVDAQLAGQMGDRAAVVAADEHHAHTAACRRCTACAAPGLASSPKASTPSARPVSPLAAPWPARPRCGPARPTGWPGPRARRRARPAPPSSRAAQAQRPAPDAAFDAAACHRPHIQRSGHHARAQRLQHRPRQRVLAAGLQRAGQRQQRVARIAVSGLAAHQPRLAFGEGAGLVEGHHVHRAHQLHRLGVAHQDAAPRRQAGAHHQRGRRGQAQRAGAGDHQHRHRMDQRLARRRAAGPSPAA
jgi:hypothetical protein